MSQAFSVIFSKLPVYWKLATVKCAIYASIVGWGVFKAGVNGYAQFSDMTRMEAIELAGDIIMAMAAVWMAFIDQTMNKVQDGQNLKVTDTVTTSREISAAPSNSAGVVRPTGAVAPTVSASTAPSTSTQTNP